MKALDFLYLLATRPREAWGRLEGIVDARMEPLRLAPARPRPVAVDCIGKELVQILGVRIDEFLNNPTLPKIEDAVFRDIEALPPNAPFPRSLNGDFLLARLCYAACRALKPRIVIETGVCYGVTTTFVLQALHENRCGVLHSIDLPPLGRTASDFVGVLVPPNLKSRWILHRGTSKSCLPTIVKQAASVDIFIHDSLHTYRNIFRELRVVTPYLARPSLVISDDIEGHPAFNDWVEEVRAPYWSTLQQRSKKSLLGIAAFPPFPVDQTENATAHLVER